MHACRRHTEVRDAVQGARVLADMARLGGASDAYDQELAPHATSAILALVECRMKLLHSVIAGDVAPAVALAHHNEAWGPLPDYLPRRRDILIPTADSLDDEPTGDSDPNDPDAKKESDGE